MTKIAVVILNYKLREQTLSCVKSVLASSIDNLSVFVVDNNSSDGVEEELPDGVNFIQTGQNKGYSGGNNVAIRKALSLGFKYIFILNPDTTVDKDALKILVEKSLKFDAGIACPKIYFEDGKTIWYAGGIFDKENVLGFHRGVDEKDEGQYDEDEETGGITGAAVLIRRDVFERIGLFDERYFLYYEDSDFYFRAKRAGFRIMYIPKAKVYHKNAQSTGLGSELQDYHITRSRMIYASKFLPFRTRFALFREALNNLGNPARRKALIDFLFNNLGRGSI